jgi:hypothetical protein
MNQKQGKTRVNAQSGSHLVRHPVSESSVSGVSLALGVVLDGELERQAFPRDVAPIARGVSGIDTDCTLPGSESYKRITTEAVG